MMPADDLPAVLAEMAERERLVAMGHVRDPQDVPRLLAAVDAVLKLADELTGEAAPSSAYEEDRLWLRAEIGSRFRSAVLAALTGKGESGG